MASWLDRTIEEAWTKGTRHVVNGEPVNRLQRPFVEDARLVGNEWTPGRLSKFALLIEGAVITGDARRACFVMQLRRNDRRVAVDLIPEGTEEIFASRERSHAMLAGGDVNAVIFFRGKDVMRNPDDCVALLARLEHAFFSQRGFDQALVNANPSTRNFELTRHGTTFVPTTWGEDDIGELRWRKIKVVRRVRRVPRRMAA